MAKAAPQQAEEGVAQARPERKTGLTLERYFTRPGVDPYDEIDWESRSATIVNEKGKVVFEQTNVEIPKFWSQMATNVVVSKYFRGPLGSPQREHSVKQLIGRVVDTVTAWGRADGYFAGEEDAQIFADELTHILVHQKACFNSPVWFNCGIEEKPQCSACFILSVDDTMESILDWYRKEGIIFKGGSGSGVNLSRIRSAREQLAGGGTASGPVSFMKAADASAGVIKSGGKTRRAAKMVILNADHPDIEEFIKCKVEEEKKAWALIEAGYDSSLDGPAYGSVFFQNANNSVRVNDDFMHAVLEDREWKTRFVKNGEVCATYRARDLLRMIAEGTYLCGDPGMQFDTTINDWHTCSNTGRINASNPCSEYMHLDNSACNLASLNLLKFLRDDGGFEVESFRRTVDIIILAQDILVDNASYPTPEIGANAHKFRELGMGYANLGALLMSLGLPYDSDAGRAYAAAITALMSGEGYLQSARTAASIEPFPG
jgi:ribonucleoside-diphosphate reductase alpha chain